MALLVPPIFQQQMALPSLPLLTSPNSTQTYFTLQVNTTASLAETRPGTARSSALSFWGEDGSKLHTAAGLSNPLPPAQKYIGRAPISPTFPLPTYRNPHGGTALTGRWVQLKKNGLQLNTIPNTYQYIVQDGRNLRRMGDMVAP